MPEILNDLRLDGLLMANQLEKTSMRFGMDLSALIREGVAKRLLLQLSFQLIRDVSAATKEIHAKFVAHIDYKPDGCVEYRVRWNSEDNDSSAGMETELCGDFAGVITHLLKLAANAPRCYWVSAIVAETTSAGDIFCREHGYIKTQGRAEYIDATNLAGPEVPNSECEGLTAHVHASNAFMGNGLG